MDTLLITGTLNGTRHTLEKSTTLDYFFKWSLMRKHHYFTKLVRDTWGKGAELVSVVVKSTGEVMYE